MPEETFTNKLETFFDNNNQPGGYIITSVNISNDDLNDRINTIINSKGFLTSNSQIQYSQIINQPILASVAITGNYNDLINTPTLQNISITRHINEGTRIASITIDGQITDLFAPTGSGSGSGGNSSTIDWNNVINKPSLYTTSETDNLIINIKGTNEDEDLVVRDGITQEIIDDYSNLNGIKQIIQSSHIVIDLQNTYGYTNFGTDFIESYDENNENHLIPDIFSKYSDGKNVIYLKFRDDFWLVTQFIKSTNEYGIILNKVKFSYDLTNQNQNTNLQSINFYPSYGIILFDNNNDANNNNFRKTYFKFYDQTFNFLNINDFHSIFQRAMYDHPDPTGNNYFYPTAPDLDDTNTEDPVWSRVVTMNTLMNILSGYQMKGSI